MAEKKIFFNFKLNICFSRFDLVLLMSSHYIIVHLFIQNVVYLTRKSLKPNMLELNKVVLLLQAVCAFGVFQEGKLIWEQEMYSPFTYSCPTQFFHSFAADVGTGLFTSYIRNVLFPFFGL